MTLSFDENFYKLLKHAAIEAGLSASKLIEKTMNKIVIRKATLRPQEEISELGKRLLAMPIEEGDEFDKEMMKETAKTRKEPSAGSLKDLQKELGLKQHAS